jgi:predicted nucleic acid-binding protein
VSDRYWDANAFLGWLDRVPGRFSACDAVVKQAERGNCRIVTSTITWGEVYWMKTVRDQAEQIKTIDELFGKSWIVPIEVDKPVAQLSRELLYAFGRNGLKPNDSIHLASAIRARVIGSVEYFDTWDGGLQSLQGQLIRVRGLTEGTDLMIGPAPEPPPDLLTELTIRPSSVL